MIRQTRIFVPLNSVYNHETWAETLFGRIIKPAIESCTALDWFWFSRYSCSAEIDNGDCNIYAIPSSFMDSQSRCYRSVRFRYSIKDSEGPIFEKACQDLIDKNECKVSDFRNYELIGDLGSDRHIGGDRNPQRRRRRAEVIVQLYHAISLLALDALIGPDQAGRFRFEDNDSVGNPNRSSFETPHHVFCNITDVPLVVLVSREAIGTHWAPPPNPVGALRIRF